SRVFGVSISNLPQHAETSFIFAISVKGQRQIEAQCFGSLRILRKTKRFIKLRNGSPVVLALGRVQPQISMRRSVTFVQCYGPDKFGARLIMPALLIENHT